MADNRTRSSDPIIAEAQDRFDFAYSVEAESRKLFIEDLKFVEADSDNGFQWPEDLRFNRDMEERPALTINKTRAHCLQIINDAKQNKPGIKYMPTGNGATFEAAQVWTALARRIEYQSNAQSAYMKASEFQVKCGVGYWRIVTDYVDTKSFDQDIYIRRIIDPLRVLMDPEAEEADKSDARYAFIFKDYNRKEFIKRYPKYKEQAGEQLALAEPGYWVWDDMIKVAEYYRITTKHDTLWLTEDGQTFKESELKLVPEALEEVKSNPMSKSRKISEEQVMWHFIVGNSIVDSKPWAGKYIPIVQIIGEETHVNGKLDRKGHVRAMKDPQRIYNYWTSAAVEFGALQSKSPYIAPAEAIEGYETYWESSNRVNHTILPYNAYNDAGQQIMAPQRQEPPVAAPVAVTGMQIASAELEMVSGQYGPQMGQPDNSRTGVAISERQRQGDKATYHYIDGLAEGVRYTGKILLDLIPKIYDTKRALQVVADDGQSLEVQIDPDMKQIYEATLNHEQEVVSQILNPNIGNFAVMADVGPGYATKREEAFQSFGLLLTQAPQLASIVGDLMFKAADFPMADEMSMRLRRMVPPQALGKGPTQAEQQMQLKIQSLEASLSKMADQLATERLRARNKAEQKEIGIYKAITERLKVMGDNAKNGIDVSMDMAKLMAELQNPEHPLGSAHAEAQEDMGNVGQGQAGSDSVGDLMGMARQAPDGRHYIPDPTRPGKYLMVATHGQQ